MYTPVARNQLMTRQVNFVKRASSYVVALIACCIISTEAAERPKLDYAAASRAGVDSMALERRVKEGLLRVDGIAGVYFRRDILDPANRDTPFPGYHQRGDYAPLGRDFLVLPRENYLFTTSSTGTTYGTPYSYDTHVPILFMGKGILPGIIVTPACTVNIAPTIARMVGIPFPKSVDGIPRIENTK